MVQGGRHVQIVEVKFGKVRIGLAGVVSAQPSEVFEEALLGHDVEVLHLARNGVHEMVVVNPDGIELVRRVLDVLGYAGDILVKKHKN